MKVPRFNAVTLSKTTIFCILMFAGACTKTSTDTLNKEATSVNSATDSADEGVDKGACLEYTLRLCEIVGTDSSACESIQDTIQILPLTACTTGLADLPYSKHKHVASRKVCQELTSRLCEDVGPETKSCELVQEQTPSFSTNQCAEMLSQYDSIVEDLLAREEENKPLSLEKQKLIAASPVASFGQEDAEVTLVEFSDFQCPYCSQAATTLSSVKKEYGDRVRIVFRHFPLSFHPNAHLAAQAAMAADAQGKFWEFHDLLFENQTALERADLEKYAKELGLKMRKFKKALDDETYKQAVDDDLELGNQVSITGTPSMIINGVRVHNAVDTESVFAKIEAALAAQ